MLAWQHFNEAGAASYAEAASVLDVYNAAAGFADPESSLMREDIVGYLETVVRVEWPAQAEGRTVDRGTAFLEKLNRTAVSLKSSGVADGPTGPSGKTVLISAVCWVRGHRNSIMKLRLRLKRAFNAAT
jgi:hypothetical protein